jgi:uncharacterized protein (TIGR00255 family)
MLISMTGFGRSICKIKLGRLVTEIQSVNRKYLEISTSLPKELSRFDLEIRKWVGEVVSRGFVTVRLYLSSSVEEQLPDAAQLKRMKKAWMKLAKASGNSEKEITLSFLLNHMPTAVGEEEEMDGLREGVEKALDGVLEMKKREGHALAIDIGQRLNALELTLRQIEKQSPDAVAKQRQKLKERAQEVLTPGAELDERLLREIALFAEKVDIAEEITRFHSHISQFREIIQAKNAQVGRKLDFLVQEMGREINTIGSKSADVMISRFVVDAKSELEKVREQIQNIE